MHPERHEELRGDLMLGLELDPSDRRAVEECAECQAELAEVQALLAPMQKDGEAARDSILAEAGALRGAPGEEESAERLHRTMGLPAQEKTPFVTRLVWVAAAAFLALLVWRSVDKDPGLPPIPADFLLSAGAQDFALLAPLERVESIATFEWEASAPLGGSYEILVFDAALGPGSSPLAAAEVLQPRWKATIDLPETVLWKVIAKDESGRDIGYAAGWASRSSP